MNQVLALSAVKQAALVRHGEISSRELIRAHVLRIAEVNPRLNAAIEVFTGPAMEAATAADRRIAAGEARRFEGVPFSVKDSIEIAGAVCTAGTVGRARACPAERDAAL